jgi:tetratricopeptide (TPR) repeat protein
MDEDAAALSGEPASMPEPAGSSAGFALLVDALSRPWSPKRPRRAAARAAEDAAPEDPLAQAMALADEGRFDESIALCLRHRPGWIAAADATRLGQCDFLILRGHQSSGRARDAVEAGFRALSWFAYVDQPPTRLYTYGLLALALACIGDAPKAFELLDQGRRLLPTLEEGGLYPALFFSYSGSTLSICGLLAEAAASFERSLQYLDAEREPTRHRIVMQNLLSMKLAFACERPGGVDAEEVEQLIATYREYAERDRAAGHFVSLAKNAQSIGDAYWRLGRLDEARAVLMDGIRAAEIAKSGPDRGILLWRLARLDRTAGDYRGASATLAVAIELLGEGQLLSELADAHLEAAKLHEVRQRWRAAVDSLREHLRIREQVQRAHMEARMRSLRVQLDIAHERAAFDEALGAAGSARPA